MIMLEILNVFITIYKLQLSSELSELKALYQEMEVLPAVGGELLQAPLTY
jgi:hypothetical protein